MKTFRALTILALLLSVSLQTTVSARRVENPVIRDTNTSTVDVTGFTTDSDATVLDIHARYIPKYWIKIASDTYLEAEGKQYRMTKAEGITPGEEFWMPESGEAEFRLWFEPVPESVKAVDFIEGDAPGAFRLWEIDMTGNADPFAVNPAVPSELLDIQPSFAYMAPVLDVAPTMLNIHVAGFHPEKGTELECYVNSLTGQKQTPSIHLDENGNGTLDLTLAGTSYLMISIPGSRGLTYSLMVAPGENLEVYLDGNLSGRMAMASRDANKDRVVALNAVPGTYHSGVYAPYSLAILNAMTDTDGVYRKLGKLDIDEEQGFRHDMTIDEYMDRLLDVYRNNISMIEKNGLTDAAKTFMTQAMNAELLYTLAETDWSMQSLYWKKTGADWNSPIPDGAIKVTVGPEEWRKALEAMDVDNPAILPIIVEFGLGSGVFSGVGGLYKVLPEDALLSKMHEYYVMMKKLDAGAFTEEDMAKARGLGDPFYAKALQGRIDEMEAVKAKYSNVAVQAAPEVAAVEVFDAIVAPYKGKLVIVDLWNTWCGPCRAAIKATEPLKETELKKDDIVWIYIANETSPEDKYLEMASGIKGIHYRLNSDQWHAICDRFNVDGIPYYILVDRYGNAAGRPDLRDHELYKKTLLEN